VIKTIAVFLALLLSANFSLAETTTFQRVKLVDTERRQTKATLTFRDDSKAIEVHPADQDSITIPYDNVDKITYEYTKKHRIGTGALVLLTVSVVGGIVVMCTQSKKHLLDIDYHADQDAPRNVVLRLHKHEYQKVLSAVKSHTGKDVEVLGCRMCKMKN